MLPRLHPMRMMMEEAISTARIHPIMTEAEHPGMSINRISKIPVNEVERAGMEDELVIPLELWTLINVELPTMIILRGSSRTMEVNSNPRYMSQTPRGMKMLSTRNQVDMTIWDILPDQPTSKVHMYQV